MNWLRQKHDGLTMIVVSVLLTAVTLAALWDEIGFLGFVPSLLLAPLGLVPAWFLWAWAMISKGYLPAVSPAAATAIAFVMGPVLWLAVRSLARSASVPHPKAFLLAGLALVFLIAFLLPSRRTG